MCPKFILELGEAEAGDGRYESGVDIAGKKRAHLRNEFGIQHIAFGDGKKPPLVEKFGIIEFELVEEDVVLGADVGTVGRDHKQKDRITLDVAQEAGADPFTLVGTLDDAGDVGHHERMTVANLDDTEVGFERGEGIVGDLRTGGGNSGEKGGFTGIGETYQTDVGENFELKDESPLLTRFAGLGIVGGLVGGGFKVPVTQTAATAGEKHLFLAVLGNFGDDLARVGILGYGSERDIYIYVSAGLTRRTGAITTLTVLGKDVPLELKVNESPKVGVAAEDDVTPTTAVAPVRPAECNELLAPEMSRPGPPITRTGENLNVIYEVAVCHIICKPERRQRFIFTKIT